MAYKQEKEISNKQIRKWAQELSAILGFEIKKEYKKSHDMIEFRIENGKYCKFIRIHVFPFIKGSEKHDGGAVIVLHNGIYNDVEYEIKLYKIGIKINYKATLDYPVRTPESINPDFSIIEKLNLFIQNTDKSKLPYWNING